MLDKFKQLNDLRKLRSQAMQMKKQLAAETVEVEDEDIKVVVSGDQEIRSIQVNGENQEQLVQVLNRALQQAQKQAAMKMAQMSGGLQGLLGK
ncbi:YbaB/EbfC family nucleoid-associated protein [Patescibacteria group bacterium]